MKTDFRNTDKDLRIKELEDFTRKSILAFEVLRTILSKASLYEGSETANRYIIEAKHLLKD